MSEKTNGKKFGNLRLVDFLIVIIFLSAAVFSINIFRLDLMQTINMRNKEPIGIVVIRKNIVQRRLSDRVLWDRLAVQSYVYDKDLIRVADLSEASLQIDGNNINLGENTLIRIRRASLMEGLQIFMSEGNILVTAEKESKQLSIDVNEYLIQANPGSSVSIFNVTSDKDTMTLSVIEGSVIFIDDGKEIEIISEENIRLNTNIKERQIKPELVKHSVSDDISETKSEDIHSEVIIEPAIPYLDAPKNLQPARGRRYTTSELQVQRSLHFSWQAVNGANAYLLTIYRQSGNRRRQIFKSQPLTRASFSLENLSILDNGTFVWQVEAIKRKAGGSIEQRGAASESTFIMDIVLPGRVKTEGMEIIDE